MGFPVEYVASYATPGSGNDYRWSRRLRARLRAAIARGRARPDRLRRHPSLRGAARGAAVERHRGLVPAAAVEARREPGAARPRGRLRRRARAGRARRVRGRGPDRGAARARAPGRPDRAAGPRRAARPRRRGEANWAWTRAARRSWSRSARGPRCARPPGGRSPGSPVAARSRSRRSPRRSAPPTKSPDGVDRPARHLPDEPLLRRFRRRGRRRRLQRLPRADRARGAQPVRADGAPHRRPACPRPLRRPVRDRPRRRRPGRPAPRGAARPPPGPVGARGDRDGAHRPPSRHRSEGRGRVAGRRRPASPRRRVENARGATESTRRRGAKEFRRRWGSVLRQLAADRRIGSPASRSTKPRARALVFAVGIDPARGRRGGAGGRRRRRGAAASGPWWSPTRSGRSARCARSGSGSSTSRRVELARRSSAGLAYEDFVRRTAGADPRRAPAPAQGGRRAGWTRGAFGTLRSLLWRPLHP